MDPTNAADRTRSSAVAGSGLTAEPMGKFEWQKLILSLEISPHTKLVALAMSIYASRDGASAHPGNYRLRLELRLSRTTVLRHVAILRDQLRLIERTERVRAGRPGRGRHAKADVYRLVLPYDLPDRVRFVDYGRDDSEVVSSAEPLNSGSGLDSETTSLPEVVSIAIGSGLKNASEVVSPVRPHQVVDHAEKHHVVAGVINSSVEVVQPLLAIAQHPDSKVVSANGDKPSASRRPDGLTDEQWAEIAWLAGPAEQLAAQHRGQAS